LDYNSTTPAGPISYMLVKYKQGSTELVRLSLVPGTPYSCPADTWSLACVAFELARDAAETRQNIILFQFFLIYRRVTYHYIKKKK
jgi:hypothetical protein